MNRGEFLQRTVLSLGCSGCATTNAHKKIPIGLELNSLRAECKADFPGALAAVAKIGYRGVEFAGYWGRSAKELRQMIDDNGGGPEAVIGEDTINWPGVFEQCETTAGTRRFLRLAPLE